MSSAEKKNQTLGMSHGAASGRLRKLVLFRQLKKHGDNICVRCQQFIKDADDLSIEHLKPWEGISAELFWDLDNVAFSHVGCNRPHRTDGGRKVGPEGTAWCIKHQSFQPIDNFYRKETRWNGLHQYCKACHTYSDKRVNHAKKIS